MWRVLMNVLAKDYPVAFEKMSMWHLFLKMIFNASNATFQVSEISLPRPVRFWLFLLLDIPSIYCSFILLFYLFIDKTLRSQLNNHITINLLIIGLIIEFIDIPFHLSFLYLGAVQPSTPFFLSYMAVYRFRFI
jgi:hypothetical protein